MTYRNHPLLEAARFADAQAEERGLPDAVAQMGLDLDTVMHVANQRAMRLTILTTRGEKALIELTSHTQPTPFRMTGDELALTERFTLAVLDGIVIGWKANDIADRSKA